jgi:hypothetical protein
MGNIKLLSGGSNIAIAWPPGPRSGGQRPRTALISITQESQSELTV